MKRLRRLWAIAIDRSILLLVGALVGLAWANIDVESYERLTHALHFVVNDIGMAFFFALAAKEVVEATAPNGALHSPQRAAMPLVAAVGGMVGPAAVYIALAFGFGHTDLVRGWAIPCATDIAFSYLIARTIFGARHPAIPFLLLLAIADDALGLLILAVFYPSGAVRPLEFAILLAMALACAAVIKRRRTRSFWPYVLAAGSVSWVAFYRGGLHPALALVPIVPFIPHAARDAGLLIEGHDHDPLTQFEHWWKTPVQIVLLLFGLVNAGVPVEQTGPGTWIVLAAILAGKPAGILLSTAVGVKAGLHRPEGVSWRDLVVVGLAAAIGFTVALFFATAAFPEGDGLDQAKMGALLSFLAAPLAAVVAAALRVGARNAAR